MSNKFALNPKIIELIHEIMEQYQFYFGSPLDLNKVDDYGEYIVMKRLYKNPGVNVMRNFLHHRHFMDLSVQIWRTDNQNLKMYDNRFDKIDVKTYPRYNN